jgi:hypothetical protein
MRNHVCTPRSGTCCRHAKPTERVPTLSLRPLTASGPGDPYLSFLEWFKAIQGIAKLEVPTAPGIFQVSERLGRQAR